ncbi:MAG: hypothetical protein KDK72_02550 [Chlamydiia bacterium]|nr:hypothetical protein [Chlamydiia bacterium]
MSYSSISGDNINHVFWSVACETVISNEDTKNSSWVPSPNTTSTRCNDSIDLLASRGEMTISLHVSVQQAIQIIEKLQIPKIIGTAYLNNIELDTVSIVDMKRKNWNYLTDIVATLIVQSTFWESGINFPDIYHVSCIEYIFDEVLENEEYQRLEKDESSFVKALLSYRNNLKFNDSGKLDFFLIDELINRQEEIRNQYFCYLKMYQSRKSRIDFFKQCKDAASTHAKGYTHKSGERCYIAYQSMPREAIALTLHELAHAYFRLTKVVFDPDEEGMCEYVMWRGLRDSLRVDEKTATNYVSKVPNYREGFTKMKEKFSDGTQEYTLQEAIQEYSRTRR